MNRFQRDTDALTGLPLRLLIMVIIAGVALVAILGFLVMRSYPGISIIRITIILIFCLGFSALDEYWQSFIPGRDSNAWDILADNIGVWIGAGIGIASIFHNRDD